MNEIKNYFENIVTLSEKQIQSWLELTEKM
jgi:hypothetical protein